MPRPRVSIAARWYWTAASPPTSGEKLPLPQSDLDLYRNSGLTVIKTTIGGYDNGFEDTVSDIALFQQVVELHPDVFMQVRHARDFAIAKRDKKPVPRQPQVADYIDHMAHALKVCGEDHVGIGSDQSVQPFDTSPKAMQEFEEMEAKRHAAGVAAPEEDRPLYVVGLNVPNRCEVIADALLKRGYPERVAKKVLGTNFVRAFTAIWRA